MSDERVCKPCREGLHDDCWTDTEGWDGVDISEAPSWICDCEPCTDDELGTEGST